MEWGRSRSGCFFCFYQQRIEWVRLRQTHPHLFEEAKRYEEQSVQNGQAFYWAQNESLAELERPERMAQIESDWEALQARKRTSRKNRTLAQTLGGLEYLDEPHERDGCLICSI